MTNCSTSAASCWELKLNGLWRDSQILRVRAHKKFNGSTGLLDLDFIFMFRVNDLRSGITMVTDGTLSQSNGKTLNVCRMAFAVTSVPFIYKASWRRWINFRRICFGKGWCRILVNKWIFWVFKERSVYLVDHALLFLASQIQKKHSIELLLICFIVVLMVWFFKPKLLKQYITDLE